jgi:Abortive infection C-terminus
VVRYAVSLEDGSPHMSDLSNQEKRKFERIFGMGSGYVLDFSNRTFGEFIEDTVARNIFDEKYNYGSGSKANRFRAFWNEEPNHLVARTLRGLIAHGQEQQLFKNDSPELMEACLKAIARLEQGTTVAELDALKPLTEDKDFEALAQEVRDAINANKLEAGLDRLHTFVIKFVRSLCEKRGLTSDRDKPLHSLFGEYVKRLRSEKHLESDMSERILKSSISILEAFNDVRNNQSLAHDNKLLIYDESLLIFNHVAASVRFLRSLEARITRRQKTQPAVNSNTDDIPF